MNVAREVTRKRSEKIIPIKVVLRHGKLVERVRYSREWRKQPNVHMCDLSAERHSSLARQVQNPILPEAYHMAQLRDLPPMAGANIWVCQIEWQLNVSKMPLEKGESSAQKVKRFSPSPQHSAKTRHMWLHDINRWNMGLEGRPFEIVPLN
ncbi:uncharacterized protein LACBIDRAFT_299704 [Laccaria bicolor S238N-H82]|uniref:Predicted protein n=1 Tax=Laccaria bicolor (strain S238N-H82 / ATCC MYA-4686) TaxID=486041 RepID=B0DF83_LACBS|nr:uncharacterized protein LACBIDRAFT_299704 [Laccaria bicolor S238N-H82]EDR06814.1 predicted protein [Laccaria bicolor S238N-H82]|eukprot:XP_001882661.1 predicted protein [Laccaria bicolor S238N-H82]